MQQEDPIRRAASKMSILPKLSWPDKVEALSRALNADWAMARDVRFEAETIEVCEILTLTQLSEAKRDALSIAQFCDASIAKIRGESHLSAAE
jgi:hypothetical protein